MRKTSISLDRPKNYVFNVGKKTHQRVRNMAHRHHIPRYEVVTLAISILKDNPEYLEAYAYTFGVKQ